MVCYVVCHCVHPTPPSGTHQLLHQPPDLLDMVVLSGGAVPPKKQVEHQPPADIVNIGSRPLLRKGMRQDQIILSSSLDIDEDQLKKDIQRELPNVCDVEIQYQEDVSTPGAVSAVLVFSYSDPVCMKAKPDPLEERIEVLPDTQELPSINAGKEGRASKPNSDDGHENGTDVQQTHKRDLCQAGALRQRRCAGSGGEEAERGAREACCQGANQAVPDHGVHEGRTGMTELNRTHHRHLPNPTTQSDGLRRDHVCLRRSDDVVSGMQRCPLARHTCPLPTAAGSSSCSSELMWS